MHNQMTEIILYRQDEKMLNRGFKDYEYSAVA